MIDRLEEMLEELKELKKDITVAYDNDEVNTQINLLGLELEIRKTLAQFNSITL